MRDLPLAARLLVLTVVGIAAALVVAAIEHVTDPAPIVVFAGLFVLADSLPVGPGAGNASRYQVVVTAPVAISAYIVLGVWGGILVSAASVFDLSRTTHVKRAFNVGQAVLAAGVAGLVYELAGGVSDLAPSAFPAVLIPTLLSGIAYALINALLVGLIVTFAESDPSMALVWTLLVTGLVRGPAYSALALVLAVLWTQIGPLALLFGLLPLYVARWALGLFAAEEEAYTATIRTLVQAVETKDAYTRGHSERVARASVMIAQRLRMSDDRRQALEYAGTLHDVGKLGVPTTVLRKSGKLTDEEFEAIKLHPTRGHDIVRDIRFLDEALAGIYHHHERIDGRGYPSGLKGGEIPEFARIIAVADAFDSMTSTRSYRSARSIEEAVDELYRCRDSQFDPVMVEALVDAVLVQGWQAAVPPTAEEISAQNGVLAYDDDDPMIAGRGERTSLR
jgi:hypothetical protein